MTYTTLLENKNKKSKLRNNEYYDIQDLFDKLYKESIEGYKFSNLIELITSRENILLAYRNIKNNIRYNIHNLIHATEKSIIDKYLNVENLDKDMIDKINVLRNKVGNYSI